MTERFPTGQGTGTGGALSAGTGGALSAGTGGATVPDLLAERVRRDGARPLVTYLHATTSERMELSAASLANAIAKTAGLLRDDLDAEPGDIIAVHLPLHWQAAVWWGACAATATVCAPDAVTAPIGVTTSANLGAVADCTEQVVVSLAPFGLPDGADVPDGITQAAIAARVHPDVFTPWAPPAGTDGLLRCEGDVLTHTHCLERSAALAETWGLHPGGRLLVTDADLDCADPGCIETWLALLAVPLVADASVVLVAGTRMVDADHRGSAMAAGDTAGEVAGDTTITSVIRSIVDSEKITASVAPL